MTHTQLRPLPNLANVPGIAWTAPPLSPHPHDAKTLARVMNYLGNAPVFYNLMEYTEDLIGGAFGVAGGSSPVSDGTYYWRLDAVEYLRHYPIALPEEAVEHFASHGWSPPHMTKNERDRVEEALDRIFQSRPVPPRPRRF